MHRVLALDISTGVVTESEVQIEGLLTQEESLALAMHELAINVRRDRNRRLADCDWTTQADVPMQPERRSDWMAYRQALRDVPEQDGFPREVTWPSPP